MCESFTNSKYPLFFRYSEASAMMVTAVTKNEANTYHPNKVEYQCVSIDMIQSHDMIDSVTIKNTKYKAASLKFFLQNVISPVSSKAIEFLRDKYLKIFHPARKITALIKKKGIFKYAVFP